MADKSDEDFLKHLGLDKESLKNKPPPKTQTKPIIPASQKSVTQVTKPKKTNSFKDLVEKNLSGLDQLDKISIKEKVGNNIEPTSKKIKKSKAQAKGNKKANKNLFVKPEDTLDLHHLTVAKSIQKCTHFIQYSFIRKMETVLIITGKGLHSEDGQGILKTEIRSFLNGHPLVEGTSQAPFNMGGEGAILVYITKNTGV